ncbi:unnamed protein product [Microthlaspi erraticum]|uniref:RRM domain-containing protein n=1 Tax=Microthlaspi erraticum TaxID=1685480 RepID=A0A6D2KR79_9BRAS|nr:unnamed protein product [Microthlaspi erraticum]
MDTSVSRGMPVISGFTYNAELKRIFASIKPQVRFCVKGYDTSLPDDDIKKALISHFNSCGEIYTLVISRDLVTVTDDVDKSCAFMVLRGEGAEEKALALNGSDLGGWNVSVVKVEEKQKTLEEVEAFHAVYYDKNRRFGISVTGFDTSLPEDDLKTALRQEFASCGEILHVYIPTGDGVAYVYFSEEEAIARALELYGHGSRRKLFGGFQAQARAVERAGWKLVAMPLTNYAIPPSVGSHCFGYTIPRT